MSALIIFVNQEAEFFDFLVLLGRQRVADLLVEVPVVGLGRARHELKATGIAHLLHESHRLEDVVGLDRQMLESCALILFEVGLDL